MLKSQHQEDLEKMKSLKIEAKNYLLDNTNISSFAIDLNFNRAYKATLGGCLIEKVNQTVIISKEH